MKILLIEDEGAIAKPLIRGLENKNFTVEWAKDGEEALELYYDNRYDLILLDLNLPKIDGMDVLQEIRKEDEDIKILILSARTAVEDKVSGLDNGANDYLAKPFHFKEIEARIHALLRRDFSTLPSEMDVLGLKINLSNKQVIYLQEELNLTKKEYSILEYLMLNKGRCISAEELIEHVWQSDTDEFTGAVKVHMNALRKKLPEDFIKNKRGQGYYVG